MRAGRLGQARRLGLTLAQIREIVALRRAGSAPCTHVRAVPEQKAADLRDPRAHARRAPGVADGPVSRRCRRRDVLRPFRERPSGRGACGDLRDRGGRAGTRRRRAPAPHPERPPRRRGLVAELVGARWQRGAAPCRGLRAKGWTSTFTNKAWTPAHQLGRPSLRCSGDSPSSIGKTLGRPRIARGGSPDSPRAWPGLRNQGHGTEAWGRSGTICDLSDN